MLYTASSALVHPNKQCQYRVPGVNQQRVPKSVGMQQQPDWCHKVFLQEDLQVVYVPVGGSVYGFRVQDGERINNWEDIHKQPITAVVHPPGSNHIITGSHDMTAKVCMLSCFHLFLAPASNPSLLLCNLWGPSMSSQGTMI